jgi:hypothetical protein
VPHPAPSTLRNERQTLNHLFRYARRKGYLSEMPEIPSKAVKPSPRPDIPEAGWRTLCEYLETPVIFGTGCTCATTC